MVVSFPQMPTPQRLPTLDGLPQQTQPAAQVTIVDGRAAGRKFKVESEATIGRSPDALIMLDDPEVSRVHARIRRTESLEFEISDADSKNGVFVNGVRVERRVLAFGDKIRVGPRILLEFNDFNPVEDQLIQRQRFEAIGRLGVGIAHDLNNVLAALDAGAAFLRDLPSERCLGDEDVRECITDLGVAAARASELTRGILSFARGRGADRRAIDLSLLLAEVVRMLRHTLDRAIQVEAAVEPSVLVHGNQSELHQVILNLCLNARDAMPKGGTLRVAVERVASPPAEAGFPADFAVVRLVVADDGVGMDAETQRRLFEPFYSTKREGLGYGLGLATVREIITLHGGRVVVESKLSQGSRFSVYLPELEPESIRFTATAERAPAALQPQKAHVSVLLVDDEQIVRRSMGRLLRQAGFDVTEAADGAEAIAYYSRRKYDLVLMDLDMPGMDGEQTQARLVILDPYIRIVFASGHVDPKREASVRARGALAFLQKPFTLQVLSELVSEILSADVSGEFDEPTRPR